jgi:signal transduction histidine kinase
MQTQLSAPPDPINQPADPPAAGTLSWRRGAGWLVVLLAGPALLLIVRLFPELNQAMLHDPLAHLLITLVASSMGVVLALLVLQIARRASDGRVFLVGMGFLSTAGIFITHSISTPSVVMSGRSLATSLSALLSLLSGGVFFALSGLEISPALNRALMRRVRLLLAVAVAFYLVYNWLVLIAIPGGFSDQVGTTQAAPIVATAMAVHASSGASSGQHDDEYDEYGSSAQPALTAVPATLSANLLSAAQETLVFIGLACYGFALWRHFALYRRSPSPAGIGMTYGIGFFGEALLTQYFSQLYTLSFWLYHLQEFIGFAVISYAVLVAYRRGFPNESLLESMFLAGTRARMRASYASAMDALVESLSRGEQPGAKLRDTLRLRFGLTESQVQVLEGAASAVAEERRQRQELERLNQALRQLEEYKRQLTQMVVHDLKNPLTAMIGFVEILRLDGLTEDQGTLVQSALRSGKNLSDLIADLLEVDRIEEGRLELERSSFAPADMLHETAAEMAGWLAQDNKTITIDAPADLPPLYADLRLMRRVMLNLLSNAIKHTLPGTSIVLRACHYMTPPPSGSETLAPPRQIVLEVQDDGPGIPPERLEHIFEKFGRFSGESDARQHSTGLGLTLCRLVVEAHDGTIGVASVVGQGTTFRVTLPADR